MDSQEIQLKEYELCEKRNIDVSNLYWVMVSAFMAVNTAAFVGVAVATATGAIPSSKRWLALFIGSAFIVVLWFLREYRRRVDFEISINYERARELELQLGMWRNWRIYGVDRWNRKKGGFDKITDEEERKRLLDHQSAQWWKDWKKSKDYRKPVGRKTADVMIFALIFLWLVLALVSGISTL
jgi:hypothetical protein